MITFEAIGIEKPRIDEVLLKNWIIKLIELQDKEIGELTFYFCDDAYMLTTNKEYLNHDYFTDILTFDAVQDNIICGDILISLDTVLTNSKKYSVKFEEELHRVIVHGVLHLLGYKDKTTEEQEKMRWAENTSLALLKKMI